MSVSFRAYTVIGIKISRDQLFQNFERPACSHKPASTQKFCPQCGKPNVAVVERLPKKGYDESNETWHGYKVLLLDSERYDNAFVGTIHQAKPGYPVNMGAVLDVRGIHDAMRAVFEPHGIWTGGTQFGVWTVAEVS